MSPAWTKGPPLPTEQYYEKVQERLKLQKKRSTLLFFFKRKEKLNESEPVFMTCNPGKINSTVQKEQCQKMTHGNQMLSKANMQKDQRSILAPWDEIDIFFHFFFQLWNRELSFIAEIFSCNVKPKSKHHGNFFFSHSRVGKKYPRHWPSRPI